MSNPDPELWLFSEISKQEKTLPQNFADLHSFGSSMCVILLKKRRNNANFTFSWRFTRASFSKQKTFFYLSLPSNGKKNRVLSFCSPLFPKWKRKERNERNEKETEWPENKKKTMFPALHSLHFVFSFFFPPNLKQKATETPKKQNKNLLHP